MNRFLAYLHREHARLDAELTEHQRRLRPDEAEISRLKKAKLLVKDQIARWEADSLEREPA
ncbi:YdcH family protein [Sphingomonadaceae bacterium G21617-S1]|jgi:hypothetical protein|uniref:YdcH family protein n=1 Tax=Rhizorhabdus sp. TaxID=1968843 RepID=UPI0011F830AC|nr:YdcH family protein [Rhizorhabdus sp.]MBD3760536.1 YdcH family protein [Rhizorhabdus sp.]MCZ4341793.1 YdcH family protein [Sphingomonadaceae bacterium G21617-S1]TAK07457.1 MAG: DUF465 domain-containing protein [Rhizorhabdus sp.]